MFLSITNSIQHQDKDAAHHHHLHHSVLGHFRASQAPFYYYATQFVLILIYFATTV